MWVWAGVDYTVCLIPMHFWRSYFRRSWPGIPNMATARVEETPGNFAMGVSHMITVHDSNHDSNQQLFGKQDDPSLQPCFLKIPQD